METWYTLLLSLWTLSAIIALPVLLRIDAPFGRHIKRGWGYSVPNRQAWFLMEFPALVVMPTVALAGTPDTMSLFFIGIWILHYFNRACIFPWRIKTKGKFMPVSILLMAFSFNLVNGFLCGYYFGNYAQDTADRLISPLFWAGVILFGGGMLLNILADNALIRIRRSGGTGYKIPQGRMFNYVSCPNLLGEIVEWFGFAMMSSAPPAFAFALWTFANLFPRALAHHRWYRKQFSDYPQNRRAMIPFVI